MGLTDTITEEAKNLSAATGVGAGLFGFSQLAKRLQELPGNSGLVHTVSKFLVETGPNPDLVLYSVLTIATYGGYVKGARGYTAAAIATSIPLLVNKLDSVQNPVNYLFGRFAINTYNL